VLGLSSLAGWEDAVLASIGGAAGTVEQRDRQIERSGLYGEYPAIVNAYVELFGDERSADEAIKRALFLVWRAATEAPVLTGIPPLPDGTTRAVMEALDARARRGLVDDELAWMLAWYGHHAPALFELYGATPALLRYSASSPPDAWRTAGVTAAAMAGRGQMGRYWAGLAAGAP
jgi:hypothetical protein